MKKQQQTEKSESITAEMIEKFRSWTDEAAAQVYDSRLRAIERGYSQTFTELGLILLECQSRQLWRHAVTSKCEDPHSFDAWIVDCLPVSNGSAYAALKCAKALSAISPAEREEIPRGNQETMAAMSETLATSEPIKAAAKRLKPKEFREAIEREHPEQHLEAHKPLRFSPERSARKVIDEALEMAMAIEEITSRDEALEAIATSYVNTHRHIYDEMKGSSKIGAIPGIGAIQ